MPITVYPFTPARRSSPPFSFQPTLDDNDYAAEVRWNRFGQRWYLALSSINGQLVFNQALVGSPPAIDIQTARWDNGRVYITSLVPWAKAGFPPALTFEVTIRECLPVTYNGRRMRALAHDAFTLSYPLVEPPGEILKLGQGSYDIDFAQTYFRLSSLVYRTGPDQFEVSTL